MICIPLDRKLAHIMIVPPSKKTNRGYVTIAIYAINKERTQITFLIPAYNACFIFTKTIDSQGKEIVKILSNDDRRAIDKEKAKTEKPTLHVHHDVHMYMARRAASILNDKRK